MELFENKTILVAVVAIVAIVAVTMLANNRAQPNQFSTNSQFMNSPPVKVLLEMRLPRQVKRVPAVVPHSTP